MMKTSLTMMAVAMLGMTVACSVPGKSVGMESNDGGADDGADDGADAGGSTSDATSAGPGGSDVGDTGAVDTGMAESDSDDGVIDTGEDGSCPPVDEPEVPECATCVLEPDCDWQCDFSACPLECAVDNCGAECIICADPDDCAFSYGFGSCNAEGECIGKPGPDLCGGGLVNGFEDGLTQQSGCADMQVYAWSDDDTLGLVLTISGLDVNGIGEQTEFSMLAHDAADILNVVVGTNVTEANCNDAIVPPGPVIDETWSATDGTLDITITPGIAGPVADVTLTNVVFDDGGGNTVTVPTYTFSAINVGWFPG